MLIRNAIPLFWKTIPDCLSMSTTPRTWLFLYPPLVAPRKRDLPALFILMSIQYKSWAGWIGNRRRECNWYSGLNAPEEVTNRQSRLIPFEARLAWTNRKTCGTRAFSCMARSAQDPLLSAHLRPCIYPLIEFSSA